MRSDRNGEASALTEGDGVRTSEASDHVVPIGEFDVAEVHGADSVVEHQVPHEQFEKFLRLQQAHAEHCSTLPSTICLWCMFLISCLLHSTVSTSHGLHSCFRRLVLEEATVTSFVPGTNIPQELALESLQSREQIWYWITNGLLPTLAEADAGRIKSFNYIVGDLQLRQQRREPGACPLDADLEKFYRIQCRDWVAAGNSSFGWTPSSNPAFVAGGELNHSQRRDSSLQENFFAWMDSQELSISQSYAKALSWNGWIDEGTEQLQARMLFFNPDVQAIVQVTATFVFFVGGAMQNTLNVQTFLTNVHPSWEYSIPDVFLYVALVKLFCDTLQAAIDSKAQSCTRRCCLDFWRFLDWMCSSLGILIGGVFWFLDTQIKSTLRMLEEHGTVRALFLLSPTSVNNSSVGLPGASFSDMLQVSPVPLRSNSWQSQLALDDELQWLVSLQGIYQASLLAFALLVLLRFFRGFHGQPRISQVGATLARAGSDLLHFGAVFGIILLNFAFGGYLLFGGELREWSAVQNAVWSTVKLAHGRGNFEAFHRITPVAAAAWLLSFVLVVSFLLLNIATSIIVFHHGKVRDNHSDRTLGLLTQFSDVCADFLLDSKHACQRVYLFLVTKSNFVQYFDKCFRHYPPFSYLGRRCLPSPHDTLDRVDRIPYDALLEAVNSDCRAQLLQATARYEGSDETPAPRAPRSGFAAMTHLLQNGVDLWTATRLLEKYERFSGRNPPEWYRMELLFNECDDVMHLHATHIRRQERRQHQWLERRRHMFERLEPRRKHLSNVSRSLVPR